MDLHSSTSYAGVQSEPNEDKKLFPDNYEVTYNFLKLLHRTLLTLMGPGTYEAEPLY